MLRGVMKLIIAGYGWSGSGAIVDFLFDREIVCGFYRDYPNETKVLSKDILDYLILLNKRYGVEKYNAYDLLVLITGGNFGYEYALNNSFHNSFFNNKDGFNGSGVFRKNRKSIINQTFLNDVSENLVGDGEFGIDKLTHFYKLLMNSIVNELEETQQRVILFNNDVHLYNNDSYFDFRDYHKILVYRNPLDQFVDKEVITRELKKYSFERFCSLFKFVLSYNVKVLLTIIRILRDKNIVLISFERFVRDEDTRDNLVHLFNKKVEPYHVNRFDTNTSIKNIGIYKRKLSIAEVVLIYVMAYPAYLFTQSLKSFHQIL